MPEKLGPRRPADPAQAQDNRADLILRLRRRDPVLFRALGDEELAVSRRRREAASLRSRAARPR
jgi:hypothetical protein